MQGFPALMLPILHVFAMLSVNFNGRLGVKMCTNQPVQYALRSMFEVL